MKKLLCFIGAAMLLLNSSGQNFEFSVGRLYIDSKLPNLNLGTLINYKDSTAFLSDFHNKIIILDFWFTSCGACIAQFPKEDSLQKQFSDEIQIIPVAFESREVVESFLEKWSKLNHTTLSLPFIVRDSLLNTFFENIYFPHYIWIAQDRRIIAHTSEYFLTAENIQAMLRETASIKAAIKKNPEIPVGGIDLKDLYNFYLNKKSVQ